MTAVGPVLGGVLLNYAPAQIGSLFGTPILSFHLLFLLTGFGCALATNLMQRVQEPAEKPVESVWREMRTMRTFNPMLSILAAGELMLTPRGLFALGQRSLRTVRQQVKAIEEVGEEIVQGLKLQTPGSKFQRSSKLHVSDSETPNRQLEKVD
jgi:hypothetical protein